MQRSSPMTQFEREMALEIFIWPFAGFVENQHVSNMSFCVIQLDCLDQKPTSS
jgi:hypothetical protein